jgi:chromosome segregation ATPase
MESEEGAVFRALKAEADTFQKAAEGRAREIENLRDEIALEEKQAELARLEAALARGKSRLESDEKNIAELGSKIAEINDTIQELALKIGRDHG